MAKLTIEDINNTFDGSKYVHSIYLSIKGS